MSQGSAFHKRLPVLSLFTAGALMLYAIESLLPPLVPIPGIRLGLANIVTLVTLKKYGARDALWVLLARILLSTFFFGQGLSLLYSLTGGAFCLLIMTLSHHLLGKGYLFLTSISGAIAHNLGQLLIAYLLTAVPAVFVYLPFLMISAILTGLFTGLCAQFTLRYLPGSPGA